MRDFFSWFGERGTAGRPWCVLGDEASLARRGEFDLGRYDLLTLGAVLRQVPARVAHFTDVETALECGDILGRAEVVVMPRRPHERGVPGSRSLPEVAAAEPALRLVADAGRLVWYNSSLAPAYGGSPVVPVERGGAEAAIALLALAGAPVIRSLGVERAAVASIIRTSGVDYAPLTLPAPARVLVAATEAEMLPFKVLEYSIRKHATMSVDVMPLDEAAGFEGRAVILDAAMLAFGDIRDLWAAPMDGKVRIPGDAGCPDEWCPTEQYDAATTALLRYSDPATRPWVATDHPSGFLWVRDLIEAVDCGAIPLAYLREHILRGWVRPSLEWQVGNRVTSGLMLPAQVRRLDRGFQPPSADPGEPPLPLSGATRWMAALLRNAYHRTPLPGLKERISGRFFQD